MAYFNLNDTWRLHIGSSGEDALLYSLPANAPIPERIPAGQGFPVTQGIPGTAKQQA